MANISFGTVTPLVGAIPEIVTAGETLADADFVRINPTDNKAYKAQCDGTSAEANVKGMVVYGGGILDDPICIIVDGPIETGSTITQGPAVLSATAGAGCPPADLVTGNYQSQVGYSVAANTFYVRPQSTGVVKT
jgi:hypothetical protein